MGHVAIALPELERKCQCSVVQIYKESKSVGSILQQYEIMVGFKMILVENALRQVYHETLSRPGS